MFGGNVDVNVFCNKNLGLSAFEILNRHGLSGRQGGLVGFILNLQNYL